VYLHRGLNRTAARVDRLDLHADPGQPPDITQLATVRAALDRARRGLHSAAVALAEVNQQTRPTG
jgi:hypothetical protein